MKHPYEEYETSKLWGLVKSSIEELVENNDVELFTTIEYVVGYILQKYMGLLYISWEIPMPFRIMLQIMAP